MILMDIHLNIYENISFTFFVHCFVNFSGTLVTSSADNGETWGERTENNGNQKAGPRGRQMYETAQLSRLPCQLFPIGS